MNFQTLISARELQEHLQDPQLCIVDCRHNLVDPLAGERAFALGHLPGAQFLYMDRDLSGTHTGTNGRHPLPDVADLERSLGRIGIDNSRQVVAYDQNTGMWAARLWWLLRWVGHDRVAVLDGGMDRWLAEHRPVTAETTPPTTRTFVATRPQAVADAAELLADMDQHKLMVLDARAPERFRGDIEPLDPVAGRIPGAVNRPYGDNLEPTGVFKHPERLRAEFEALLDGTSAADVVHQCGSGVTACHNLLAMKIAGMNGSRLYPGSWSEWIADPSRPVARG